MKQTHQGRLAIITGGAQGIGFAIATRLLDEGAAVALWDRSGEALDKARSALEGRGPVTTQVVDVTDEAAVTAGFAALDAPVALLVNSAGITGHVAPVVEYDVETWRKVVDVNLTGTFLCCKAAAAQMTQNGFGRIVNISSVAGKEGNPNLAAYSAAKAGVIGLTKSLGKELAKEDIAVNALTPTTADTPILDSLTEEFIQYMLDRIPRGRFVKVDEIAAMVSWLLSEENSFTTASVFDLSGGRTTY